MLSEPQNFSLLSQEIKPKVPPGKWMHRLLETHPEFYLLKDTPNSEASLLSTARCHVAERFAYEYNAVISEFMPTLLLMCKSNLPTAVVGMREAQHSMLFLEYYLPHPVDEVVSTHYKRPINRDKIVEIGNLVAGPRGQSSFLFALFTSMLNKLGKEVICFTATKGLTNNLNKLGFTMSRIKEANLSDLPKEKQLNWGSYYDSKPAVYVGELSSALEVIETNPVFAEARYLLESQSTMLAKQW